MIRKELSVEDIRILKDNSSVYIVYLDGGKFDLEYCATVPINVYINYHFVDGDGNEFSVKDIIDYINNGSIKVYSTENTQFNIERKLTNYERIKNITIEEIAGDRVKEELNTLYGKIMYKGDFEGFLFSKEDAIKEEIDWLNGECE